MSNEFTYDRINDYAAVTISLAKPNDIRSWSYGEVKKPETINNRTYRPEKDGLFCEKIFGPEKDWECSCGKYRGMKYKGMSCDRCGVKITHSRVRRKRMGHIDLAAPVVHIWFFKAASCRLATLLSMKAASLEKVIYFQDYVVIDPGDTPLKTYQLLTEEEYRNAREEYPTGSFVADMGAEAIRRLLQNLDLAKLSKELRAELDKTKSKQKKKDIINRLKLVESLRDSDNKPEWMVLDAVPIIPPDLRPLVLLESGTFATSDLNDLYRRIINRNNRLKKLVDLNAPEVIIRNEKRMLQQSVDALFDNGRCKRPVLGSSNRALKSLTDMIKGKQGRFRENLLGKRVDYSARSVIVVNPTLKLHQCGLPKKIALELFQPFIIRRLRELQHADTVKSAKRMLERKDEEVWDILEEVIQNHPVLLNRAPTLHRMGIQAFEPILIGGNAIHLHPFICKPFNADFDGDQMAVHLPLSLEAQVEAHTLMLSTNNIFSPANGAPIITATQDVVMGCGYLTLEKPGMKGEGMIFAGCEEVLFAFSSTNKAGQPILDLHARIKVRMPKGHWLKTDPKVKGGVLFETTPGRIIFNGILSPGMPFYNEPLNSDGLATVISDCNEYKGRREMIDLIDRLKQLGFEWATRSGLSIAMDDLVIPATKQRIIEDAEKKVAQKQDQYMNGIISERERDNQVLDAWTRAAKEIKIQMIEEFKNDTREPCYVNPIFLMVSSGARGDFEQVRQLAGIRGLMIKPNGTILKTPIKGNFREGLTVLEYFSSTHGARKGLADTALKTADSGYLTRKLADVAQNVVVTMNDCGTTRGITKGTIRGKKVEVSLTDSIQGRVSKTNIVNPTTNEVVVRENELITTEIARRIEKLGLEKIQIRSPMTCEAELGVCAKCYGMDLSTSREVEEGTAVGIIAAQSIGEPGTQLTMRTFQLGGVAAAVIEKNEIRSGYAGIVKFIQLDIIESKDDRRISQSRNGTVVILDRENREREIQHVPIGTSLHVREGEAVETGVVLGSWDPYSVPIFAKVAGTVEYVDVTDGETVRSEKDPHTGKMSLIVTELKGDRQPQINLKSEDGSKTLDYYYLPGRAIIEVKNGDNVEKGTLLAKTVRQVAAVRDITGGLPRVTEIFEARTPKDPAVIAEIDGTVELGEKRHGKRTIVIKNEETGAERIHEISHGKHMKAQAGDFVKAGQSITDGPLVPHDILRISGEEAVQEYLVREIQNVYRSQKVKINDKHIEIIVSQMLRKVKIESAGDTKLLEGVQIDKFQFKKANEEVKACVKITDPGDTKSKIGDIVQRDVFDRWNAEADAAGLRPAAAKKTELAHASTQLLGITKAAVQSSSFISAASFQETTKVLTEAALASKTDNLIGLKENVILGHIIPAGTGFRSYQNAQWRFRHEADEVAEDLAKPETAIPVTEFSLLEDIPETPVGIKKESLPEFYNEAFDNEITDDDYKEGYEPPNRREQAAPDSSVTIGRHGSIIEYFANMEKAANKRRVLDELGYLVSQGADVNAQNGDGKFSIHFAAEKSEEVEVLEFLISQGADIYTKDRKGWTPLHCAAWSENFEIAQYLVSKGTDVNAKDNIGWTPLHRAARRNASVEVIVLLVSAGADKAAKNDYGQTPHDLAKIKGSKAVEEFFATGRTPLHAAAMTGAADIVVSLISKGACVDAKCNAGATPLHYATMYFNTTDILNVLLDKGADINAKTNNGYTPLHLAMWKNVAVAEFLVSKGANMNDKNNEGETPLDLARKCENEPVVEYLSNQKRE